MPTPPTTPSSFRHRAGAFIRRQRLGGPRLWWTVQRKRFWAVLILALYTLMGFFVAPPVLRREIVDVAQKTFQRPAALDEVHINPYALSVELRGFRLTEADGGPLLGFDRLYVRLAPSGLLRWAWGVNDIQLDGLKATLVRYGETDTNIGRLIQAAASGDDQAKADAPGQGLPRLLIRHLIITNAAADVTDQVPGTPFKTKVGPVGMELNDLSTLPERQGQQHLQVGLEGGATLEWTGTSGLNPIVSAGHLAARGPYIPLAARYFGDVFKVTVPTGTLAADLDYQVSRRADGTYALAVSHAGVVLRDLAVHEAGVATPFLTLPDLRLAGGRLAWPERTAGADSLTVDGLTLAVRRQADGRVGPMPWLAGNGDPAPAAPAPEKAAAAPWTATLGKVQVRKAKAVVEDQALHEPARLEVTPIDITLDDLSNQVGAAFPFTLAAALSGGGQVAAQGKVTALPALRLEATASLTDLPVAAAQPYVRESARVDINDGHLSAEADITLTPPDGKTPGGLNVVGKGEVRSLAVAEQGGGIPVVSWDRLSVDRFEYSQAANELRVSQVTVAAPYLRLQVAANQTTNFTHLMVVRDKSPGRPSTPPAGPAAPAPALSAGRVVVTGGKADYGDASLPLPFSAHITDLQGEVAALSSSATASSRLALRGQVGDFGQVTIDGRLVPFDPGRDSNVNLLFRNVEFPDLSPYTVKFAGRRIARGRLDVDLHYLVKGGALNGANRVVIRDIKLGDRVDVPGALDLPLDLAIALLKDDEGKINVDLPVSGNINDPRFDIGSVIRAAAADLLTNLVTAPFRALAALFDGADADKLDHIDFAPGRADLAPPEQEKIVHLAQALGARPQLVLVVPGVVAPDADKAQLQADALDARMAQALADHYTLEGQRQFLEARFSERLGADQLPPLRDSFTRTPAAAPGAKAPPAPVLDETGYVTALHDRVAKTEPVAEQALKALAQARATAVAGALKQRVPTLDAKRLSLRGEVQAKVDGEGLIPLKLEAASTGD
ncbi:DUF748 domain-containing protein [Nitrospirillum sp. BR 11164]|uniref:DUF748 domain-containing protein n=1 Tax=Nitrospirillum sp. BR 11164 TaxID=3104324 RepID=UPI002AFE865F|nr:DUF748 domain-containing protein [Nitrospirillum sp. BR 11164]MEA1648901.1 DUF748 domain-containing protein [Nitrospirillum sp. BR 11164]